jgi:hypothetical protein
LTSEISIRKTGIVIFLARIVSVFTGLIFLVMMTRTLSITQFGLWEFVIDIVTFASYPAGLVVFWATRDIARGNSLGKTVIYINLGISIVGVLLFFAFAVVSLPAIGAKAEPLLLAIFLVPLSYLNQAANAVVTGHRPSVLAYSLLASEFCKLGAAFPLLVVYRIGIDGVILSMIVAYLAQAVVSTYMVRDASADVFNTARGKRWLLHSWLPALTTLPYVVGIADTFVASIASMGTDVTGYYQAAYSIATIVGYSIYLATPLYPLLLKGGSNELPSITLDLTLLFGIPMAFGAAILAEPILFLLKPQYIDASNALIIMAFSSLIITVSGIAGTSGILDQTLLGRERADIDESISVKRYAGSNLVFVPLLNLAYSILYVLSIFLTIRFGVENKFTISQMIETWAIAQLAISSIFLIVKFGRVRKQGGIKLKPSLLSYLIGAIMMSLFLFFSSSILDYRLTALAFGIQLIELTLSGTLVYFLVILLIDKSFRALAITALKNFGKRKTGHA